MHVSLSIWRSDVFIIIIIIIIIINKTKTQEDCKLNSVVSISKL